MIKVMVGFEIFVINGDVAKSFNLFSFNWHVYCSLVKIN